MIASIACASALLLALTGPAQASEPERPPASVQVEPNIEFRFAGSRLYNVLYWRIDANGKGEVSAPSSAGYATDFENGADFRYFFKGGLHRFDIGRNGYDELRTLLADVLEGTVDQYGLLDHPGPNDAGVFCVEHRALDVPAMQLSWGGASSGTFVMPSTCRSVQGQELADRLIVSWQVIARHMLHSGHSGVIEDQPPPLSVPAPLPPPIPLTLEYNQRSIWTGWKLQWRIKPDGRGWLGLSEGRNMQLADPPTHGPLTVYVRKGRHPIDIGPEGYAKIRVALEPYISGPQRDADCYGMTDQPIVTLSYENTARAIKGQTRKDLGCRDLAERARIAERVILSAFVAANKSR